MRSPTTYLNHSQPVPRSRRARRDAEVAQGRQRNGLRVARPPDRLDGRRPAARSSRRPRTARTSSSAGAIPATADGKPFLIKGFLGWAPPPKTGGREHDVVDRRGRRRRRGASSQPRSYWVEGPPREAAGPLARGRSTASRPGSRCRCPEFGSVQWMRCWIAGLMTPPGAGREVVREILVEDVLRRDPAPEVRVAVAAAGGEVVGRQRVVDAGVES